MDTQIEPSGFVSPSYQQNFQQNVFHGGSEQNSDWCPTCYEYIGVDVDDDGATDSDSDNDFFDDDADMDNELNTFVMSECQGDTNLAGNLLHESYMMAKRRWRRYTGRWSRRKGQGKGKSHSKGGRPFGAHSYFEDSIFFNKGGHKKGKGFGTNKGKMYRPSRQNPRGPDGQLLKCFDCGSTEHLRRHCPHRKGKGKGSGKPSFNGGKKGPTDNNILGSAYLGLGGVSSI